MNLLELHAEHMPGAKITKESANKGGEYSSPCPACGGRDRFRVWPADGPDGSGKYWCRSCGAHGDVIQYLRDYRGMSFHDACRAAGREIPSAPMPGRLPQLPRSIVSGPESATLTPGPDPVPPSQVWSESGLKYLTRWLGSTGPDNPRLAWLRARGIRRDTAWTFRLADNPGEDARDLYRPRESWGLDPILRDDGKPKRLWLPRGLVIPCFGPDGAIIRLRIRRDEETGPKYYLLPGSSIRPLWAGNPSARVGLVVESELDAILIHQDAGDFVRVLAMGSALVSPSVSDMETLRGLDMILVALDADDAGNAGWLKWRNTFRSTSRRWTPPSGSKDPGDFAKSGGNVREWVAAGLPPIYRPAVSSRLARSPLVCVGREGVAGDLHHIADHSNMIPRPAAGPELPPTVLELRDLLRVSGVVVAYSLERIGLDFEPGRVSETHLRRLSELVFHDEAVVGFLSAHPRELITAGNFLEAAA